MPQQRAKLLGLQCGDHCTERQIVLDTKVLLAQTPLPVDQYRRGRALHFVMHAWSVEYVHPNPQCRRRWETTAGIHG
jgi:hypothetical protein